MNVEKINEYQVAELYHQLMIKVAIKFLPKVTTRRMIDTPDVPVTFVEGPDEINNIILYDESLLYIYPEEKLCNSYWGKYSYPEYRLIYKGRDIRVYYDEDTQIFIMVPHVSNHVRRRIRKYAKRNINTDVRYLETLAFNFCSQLKKAYRKIADRYVRDMAVFSVDHLPDIDIIDTIMNLDILADVDCTIKAIHDYYHFNQTPERIKAIHTNLWTPDCLLFNRALMVYYSEIVAAGELPHSINLIDPINYIELKGSEDNLSGYNGEITLMNSSCCSVIKNGIELKLTSEIGFVRFNWNKFLDRSDMKILSNQFKINQYLTNIMPAQILSILTYWRYYNDAHACENLNNRIIDELNGKRKSAINSKVIIRVPQYQDDEYPNQFDFQKYIKFVKH